VSVLNLISTAVGLTGTILDFIKDNRGYKIKKDIEDLIVEIIKIEKVEGHLRDDQKLDELKDTLTLKVSMFDSYLSSVKIPEK